MPEEKTLNIFDRTVGALHGLPDVVSSKPSTIRTMIPVVGVSQTFIVQTYRQKDKGDTIFLETINGDGSFRLAIPPKVAEAIARQREALGTKVRKKIAKAQAEERKQQGFVPFVKKDKSDAA